MKRAGRPEDPVFADVEKLFRRYKSEHIIEGSFTGVGLSFKNAPSLNREKYSEPQDVLFSETGVLSPCESKTYQLPFPAKILAII